MNPTHAIRSKITKLSKHLPQLFLVFAQLMCLTGCAFGPHHFQLEYAPQVVEKCDPLLSEENLSVEIAVCDKRLNQKNLGCLGFGLDVDDVGVESKQKPTDVIYNAIKLELENRNCTISQGNNLVEVELRKFQNDFKAIGAFTAKTQAEVILFVRVKKSSGESIYSQLIIGTGSQEVYLANGKNAEIALNCALNDAIYQLMIDPDFFQSLLK